MNAEMKLRIINEILAGFFGGIDYDKSAVGTLCAIPVWASEIEEFPIAVTKIRFPERSEPN